MHFHLSISSTTFSNPDKIPKKKNETSHQSNFSQRPPDKSDNIGFRTNGNPATWQSVSVVCAAQSRAIPAPLQLGPTEKWCAMARDYGTNGPPPVGFADFSPTELYTLSETIAASIQAVNAAWRHLERTQKHIGTSRDTPHLRQKAWVHLSKPIWPTVTSRWRHRPHCSHLLSFFARLVRRECLSFFALSLWTICGTICRYCSMPFILCHYLNIGFLKDFFELAVIDIWRWPNCRL